MKLFRDAFKKIKEFKKYFLNPNDYTLKVVDIAQKKNVMLVIFQCANSNTFIRYPLHIALENEYILSNISPTAIRLLSEINFKNLDKNNLALGEDGGFIYNNECEQYYSNNELIDLSQSESFINSLSVKAGFLLGYLVGKEEAMENKDPRPGSW